MGIQSRERAQPRSAGSATQPLVTVSVVLMGELQRAAGKRGWEMELASGSTVQTLLQRLSVLCGEAFTRLMLTREGAPHPHVAIFVNGEDIRELQGAQTVLSVGQVELFLVPIQEGGAPTRRKTWRQ